MGFLAAQAGSQTTSHYPTPYGTNMPRVVAIVDTNLYRGTSDAIVEDLRWLESRAGVQPTTSFHATTELLAHVESAADPSYGACRAALKRLWQHCAVYSIRDSTLRFAADANAMLAKTLFDGHAPWGSELATKTSLLVKRIALRGGDVSPDLSHDLRVIRRFRDDAELRFATMLADIRRQLGLDNKAGSDFAPSARPTPHEFLQSGALRSLAAYALVMSCASELRLSVHDGEMARRAATLGPHIPTALMVFEGAVNKVVSGGATPENFVNSLWDLHLALFAAESMRLEGHPVVVVTEDKPLLRAAAATGASSRVLNLNDYRDFLLTRAAA